MKHTFILLIAGLLFIQAHSQFKSLINKVKDKVTNKVTGQQSAKDSSSHSSQPLGTTDPTPPDAASAVNSGDLSARRPVNTPQPPPFPKTGKMLRATTAIFGIDTEEAWSTMLKQPVVQDYIEKLRQKGLTGSDKEVLTASMQHNEDYNDIQKELQAKYGNVQTVFAPSPSLVFAAFLNTYNYVMSSDYIRVTLGSPDSLSGNSGLAVGMLNAFAPGAVTIVDIKAKKTYAVADYLGILPAAIVEDISSFQDEFGLAAYFKRSMHQANIIVRPMGHTIFHGYNASAVNLEIPVTPVPDDNGKSSDRLLYLHALLSNTTGDLLTKHYDPSYKLYLQTYYTHDLDLKIPKAITADKNILHVDGFYIGSVLKDEKGNQVVYTLQKIDADTQIDEGMFLIPATYEKMTHEQFKQKVKEKFHSGN